VSVLLLCGTVSILLHVFYIYHLWLVKDGLTTNESAKQSDYIYRINKKVKFLKDWISMFPADDATSDEPLQTPDAKTCKFFKVKGSETKQQLEALLS
jgi:hypothetical protein